MLYFAQLLLEFMIIPFVSNKARKQLFEILQDINLIFQSFVI